MCKLCWNGVALVWPRSGWWMPVTASRPRPAPTARSDRLLKQSASGIRAVCFKSPFRWPVTTGSHGPLWRTSATIGARNPCRLFQKSVPAARHGRLPRPALTDFCNNRRQESVPFVSNVPPGGPSRPAVHGPLLRTSATIGAWNLCRLFQKSVPSARHGRPSTAGRPRPALTNFCNNRRQESVQFVSKVRPGGPSRPSVHDRLPRPALTNFCNNRRQESVPFVSKVRSGGPSRPAVHGRLPRPALTNFCNNRRQESVPFVSKVRSGGPSRPAVHGRLPRPALTNFCNNRRQESVPFVSKVPPGGPSRPAVHGPLWRISATIGARNPCRLFQKSTRRPVTDVRPRPAPTARSDGLLKQSAWGIRAVCFKSPSRRPVTDVRHGPLWRTSETNGAPYCRDNAVAVQWRWPAAVAPRIKLQPGIRLQRTRGTIVPGPARSVGFWIGFAWYPETTFLPTNAAGRAVAHSYVSAMVSLMTHIYFKWIIYISHNFVWMHDVVKHNSRCASVCYNLKSNSVEITDSHVALCK